MPWPRKEASGQRSSSCRPRRLAGAPRWGFMGKVGPRYWLHCISTGPRCGHIAAWVSQSSLAWRQPRVSFIFCSEASPPLLPFQLHYEPCAMGLRGPRARTSNLLRQPLCQTGFWTFCLQPRHSLGSGSSGSLFQMFLMFFVSMGCEPLLISLLSSSWIFRSSGLTAHSTLASDLISMG